jgi:hypothetical protein
MPHTAWSTTIGAPTAERMPASSMAVATGPPRPPSSSIRAGLAESRTRAATVASSTGQLVPRPSARGPKQATTVDDPSGS